MSTYTNEQGSTISVGVDEDDANKVLITVSKPNKLNKLELGFGPRLGFPEQITAARRLCGIVEGRFLSQSSGGHYVNGEYVVYLTRAYQRKGAPEASRMVLKPVYLPHNVNLSAFIGTDGALVVQVDTGADTGRVRVNVNDAPVWDADPETGLPGL